MANAPEPGTILLDKYCVERVLGYGGMGCVVAARHLRLGELFAIKMLRPDVQNKADANERFLREARALARLRGEHVVRVQDVGSFPDGSSYMLMEYLDGRDLKQVLDERGPLPLDEAVLFVMQACEAVAEAHEQGIIHRDLKPPNLFLTTRPNGTPCIKVLDFGISKELHTLQDDLTRTGAFVGSPGYVSPERLANNKIAHAQSDIWALGIVLYELISGLPPFRAKLMMDLIAEIVSAPVVPLRQHRPEIPVGLDAIVQRCLEKQPEKRYASVRALMVDLEPFAAKDIAPKARRAPSAAALPQVETTALLPMPAPAPTANGAPEPSPWPAPQAPPVSTLVSGNAPGQTHGGWGSTWDALIRREKKPLVLGFVLIASLLCVGAFFLGVQSSTDDEASSYPTVAASASASAAYVPEQPAPVTATSEPFPSAIVDTAPLPPSNGVDFQTPPDVPNAAASENVSVPATTRPKTRPTKRPTIRGFDE